MQDREYRATVFKRNVKPEAQTFLAGHSAIAAAQHLRAFDTVLHFSFYLLTFNTTQTSTYVDYQGRA